MKKLSIIASLLSLSLVVCSGMVNAKPPRDGKPPQEAIDACVEKSEGEVVTFETRRGDQMEATCKLIDEQLVAVPKDHRN